MDFFIGLLMGVVIAVIVDQLMTRARNKNSRGSGEEDVTEMDWEATRTTEPSNWQHPVPKGWPSHAHSRTQDEQLDEESIGGRPLSQPPSRQYTKPTPRRNKVRTEESMQRRESTTNNGPASVYPVVIGNEHIEYHSPSKNGERYDEQPARDNSGDRAATHDSDARHDSIRSDDLSTTRSEPSYTRSDPDPTPPPTNDTSTGHGWGGGDTSPSYSTDTSPSSFD